MSNAIKYSPNGGRIYLEVQTKDGDVAFVVRDDGVGMSEEDAARAFEPFRRSATLRDDVPGSHPAGCEPVGDVVTDAIEVRVGDRPASRGNVRGRVAESCGGLAYGCAEHWQGFRVQVAT